MAARADAVLLLLLSGSVLLGHSAGPGHSFSSSAPDSERGRMELRRVRTLAALSRYGECWARALEYLDASCRDLTSESQSLIALRFTHCHLSSSGRDFPACPEGSEVSRCTAGMDTVAFNSYTEFFTHTHSMCHFLQSEAWQRQAENTIYRLTESSAGVAEQLQSTRLMAEDLIEAQSAALQAQKAILSNGEELRVTLRDSTQGLRSVFSELSSASREQQVALSELFNRVSFLQSFLLMETHSLSSCCYNAAALCTSFLITSTPRSSRARLVLLSLVCLNFYLERKIYQFVLSSDNPEHQHMELLTVYVSALRRFMVCVGVCVLLVVCVRYRDPVQQSLQVLQQLRETQRSLQEALQHAESLGERRRTAEDDQLRVKMRSESRRRKEMLRRKEERREEEEREDISVYPTTGGSDPSNLSHFGPCGGWSRSQLPKVGAATASSAAPGTPHHPPSGAIPTTPQCLRVQAGGLVAHPLAFLSLPPPPRWCTASWWRTNSLVTA
ncbi:uncharacterized protein LOC100704737 isoform X1 [Oreochromis niloticus]|uniref:uncharacterized protein LOC100704737 isoform X1 n=1 Tax=Oreochromis niloticus TaxID=8128 RepID=UPI0009058717|nr:uncharacterized protein LOC100704737 isoform X1 [Oreochromis niloticus]XP_025757434.1 uncharacterized protein LOC100704737 isoform X1 [Oreochromis niloticus]XP_025757435.1 uncharacterized protein LOC100704737 isoform X1 [Oreochromis niloticus]XP_025757436.1 uncharacterized protein LOC100704737 isoform X1 [Oreochromis niloticus]CAI5648686.1 unnamed protein product [Mustela putorius furo]